MLADRREGRKGKMLVHGTAAFAPLSLGRPIGITAQTNRCAASSNAWDEAVLGAGKVLLEWGVLEWGVDTRWPLC